MPVLLITFDVDRTNDQLERVHELVTDYNHVRLSDGCFAIETHEHTRTIFNKLVPYLGHEVHLVVVTLIKPFSGTASAPMSAWFSKHLSEY